MTIWPIAYSDNLLAGMLSVIRQHSNKFGRSSFQDARNEVLSVHRLRMNKVRKLSGRRYRFMARRGARILCIDFSPCFDAAESTTFGDLQSSLDFDIVIWDPAQAMDSYNQDILTLIGQPSAFPTLDTVSSAKSRSDIARRRGEFRELIESGRTLFIISCPPQRFFFDTGERRYSGSGRNKQETIVFDAGDFWNACPIEVTLTPGNGTNISFCGSNVFSPIWQEYRNRFEYRATIGGDGLKAVMKIAKSERIVSAIFHHESGGSVIFLPTVNFVYFEDELDGFTYENAAHRYQMALENLATVIGNEAKAEALPQWIGQYQIDGEQELRTRRTAHQKRVQAEADLLAGVDAEIDRLEMKYQLVAGTGRPLQIEVGQVLRLLGGEISEPDPIRDDWKVQFPEGDAVVEVKGLNGSAGEKDAAQLEKWVSGHYEVTGYHPKGILVVNGWRSLPIDKRTDPVFPHQMLKYSTQRGHCLITGIQLLGILQDVESHPEKASYWRKALLETAGEFEDFKHWETVLSKERRSD